MKPLVLCIAVLSSMAACGPQVPASNAGIGGDDFARFELERARREAALANTSGPIASPGIAAPPVGSPPSGIGSADLAAAGIGPAVPAPAPVTTGPIGGAPASAPQVPGAPAPVTIGVSDPTRSGGVQATPGNAAPAIANPVGISDEQDFDAVAARESIASDAARLANNAANYQVVQPTALPQRTENGPNIVAYALAAPNSRGQEWYSRSILSGEGRFQRNCASYRSPDEAQRDFLARGGPERDPRGIDPDGDGFACGWDPAPFRSAVGRG